MSDSQTQWLERQPLFAYLDETAFDDARAFGYGMLLTEEPLRASVIDGALADLQADPDFHRKYDRATLTRGYFHASEDGKNAHSFLCRRIVASVRGEFFYATTRNDQPSRAIHYAGTPTSEDHFDMMLTDNFIRAIVRVRQVEVIVEGRSRLTTERLSRLFEGIVAHLERRAADMTYIPFYAPNVVFRTVGKSEPGIQVVDFILWALNRRTLDKRCLWVDRLGLKFSECSGARNSPEKSAVWLLGQPPPYERTLYPDGAFPLPEIRDKDWVWGAENIRCLLLGLSRQSLPRHVDHLAERLHELVPALQRAVESEALRKAASLFLRLFDTLPLYQKVPKKDVATWRQLLLLRRIASSFLDRPVAETSQRDAETPQIEVEMMIDVSTMQDRKADE